VIALANISKGILHGAVAFIAVGVVFPFLIGYFSPLISSYLKLPPQNSIWVAFIGIGILFALTSFLHNAYIKGDYPWLFGRLGSGIANLVLYIYIFALLPSSIGSSEIQSSNLLLLIYLAIGLSYGYLILDFFDMRRNRR
jgi:hypothetical protein